MSLVAMFAVIGALAAFVVLGLPNANPAEAQFGSNAPDTPVPTLEAGNQKITVTWPAVVDGGSPVTAYVVQYKVTTADDITYIRRDGPGSARKLVITPLVNGTEYSVIMYATNSVGNSGTSVEATATPGPVVSTAPRNVGVTSGSDRTSLSVSWDAPADLGGSDMTAYTVTHFTDAAFTTAGGGTVGTVDVDKRTVTITGLLATTTYYVRVTATNGVGPSSEGDGSGATMIPDASGAITSSSTSAGSTIELKVTIASLPKDLAVGSSVELYLEDDYQVPDAIARSAVYFVVTGAPTTANANAALITGNGAPVAALAPPVIATDDHFGGDDDYAIQVVIPDLCTADADACDPQNGPLEGQSLTLVIGKAAGIKNPSEQKNYKAGFSVLDVGEAGNDGPDREVAAADRLSILAEVSLSDEDNTRGYELTITGSGFNNGTTANAYVLKSATEPANCADVVARGTNIGSTLVGSDDIATVVVEVSVPTFGAGEVNWVCMVDGETRYSSDVDPFHLEPSIRAVPSTASSGDTVNIFAQDFPTDASFTSLELADTVVWSTGDDGVRAVRLTDQSLTNGAATISFEVPGSVGGEPLQGTVRVDADWGGQSEDTKITVTGSELTASKANVLPNETITITGNGFGSQTCIPVSEITLDNVAVEVDDDSTIRCNEDNNANTAMVDAVEVSNSGQFVATITLWPADPDNVDNPTLISGSHTLSVEDNQGFTGSTTLTIAEPTISVTPEVVGPRDYIVITGTNWPVDNSDNSNAGLVDVKIDDDARGRDYSVYTDATGRFTVEHRVSKDVAIPSTVQITGSYSDVVKVGSFAIPAATITVDPAEAQPGDLISLSSTDMKPYTSADEVKIGGSEVNFTAANTDIDGNITLTDLLVPGLDPGVYSVVLKVDDTVAIGELNVLAEDSARGAGAMLPDALSEVGTNLVRVFHFNGVDKSWDFYDPRADFADLNTLTTMINGEPYWILVSKGQENVVLNNKPRNLTCVGGDCWNQIVW